MNVEEARALLVGCANNRELVIYQEIRQEILDNLRKGLSSFTFVLGFGEVEAIQLRALMRIKEDGFYVSPPYRSDYWGYYVTVALKRPTVRKWFRQVPAPELEQKHLNKETL